MSATATSNLLGSMKPTTDHTAAMFFVVVSCDGRNEQRRARDLVTECAISSARNGWSIFGFSITCCRSTASVFFAWCSADAPRDRVFHARLQRGPIAFLIERRQPRSPRDERDGARTVRVDLVASAEAAMALTPIALIHRCTRRADGADDDESEPSAAHAGMMPSRWGIEGLNRARTNGDRRDAAREHRSAQAGSHERAGLHPGREISVCDRAGGERFAHRGVGVRGADSLWLPSAVPFRDDIRDGDRAPHRTKAPRSRVARRRPWQPANGRGLPCSQTVTPLCQPCGPPTKPGGDSAVRVRIGNDDRRYVPECSAPIGRSKKLLAMRTISGVTTLSRTRVLGGLSATSPSPSRACSPGDDELKRNNT